MPTAADGYALQPGTSNALYNAAADWTDNGGGGAHEPETQVRRGGCGGGGDLPPSSPHLLTPLLTPLLTAQSILPCLQAVMSWLASVRPHVSADLHGGALVGSYALDACDSRVGTRVVGDPWCMGVAYRWPARPRGSLPPVHTHARTLGPLLPTHHCQPTSPSPDPAAPAPAAAPPQGALLDCPSPEAPLPGYLANVYSMNHPSMRFSWGEVQASRQVQFFNGTTQGAT